jgi:hypothetical protein
MKGKHFCSTLAALIAAMTAVILLAAHTSSWPPPTSSAVASPSMQLIPTAIPTGKQRVSRTKTEAAKPRYFSVQVVDAETGKGIAKATILAQGMSYMKNARRNPQSYRLPNLQTDAEGRCEIPYTNSLSSWLGVAVVADGYAEMSLRQDLEKTLPEPCVLNLTRGLTVGGVVQDEAGQPVAGAGIVLNFMNGDPTGLFLSEAVATTDSAGRWTFGSAPTNAQPAAPLIVVRHPDFPTATFNPDDFQSIGFYPVFPYPDHLDVDDLQAGKAALVLKSGLTVRGVVTDEFGYHLAGAKVTHRRTGGSGCATDLTGTATQVVTEWDGSFVLPGLRPGEESIIVTSDGFVPQQIEVPRATNTASLAVELKPGGVLRLRILDQAGLPVPKARIALEWCGGRPAPVEWDSLTDSDGRAVWNSAPFETLTLDVLKDGYFNSINDFTADAQEHIITLRPSLTVAGRVTDTETKQPIASFKVLPGFDPLGRGDFILTGAGVFGTNGQFELDYAGYDPLLTLSIEADGYESLVSKQLDASAGHLNCDFELTREP